MVALAARVDPAAPAVAARLRVEAQMLDSQIRKLVAATAASDGQAVVDSTPASSSWHRACASTVSRQEQLDADATHSNLQSLRSSRPVLAGLVIAGLALALAAALFYRSGRRPGAACHVASDGRPARRARRSELTRPRRPLSAGVS